MRVLLDNRLWDKILSDIKSDRLERAYYLVGLVFRGDMIVYEAFEMRYVERGEVFLASDPMGRILITNSLPGGLRVLGILHSHPFDKSNGPQPSSVDLELAREYDNDIIMTVNPQGYSTAVRYIDGDIEFININIKRYSSEQPDILKIGDTYFVVPREMSIIERKLYVPRMFAQYMYRVYMAGRFDGSRIILPEYRWVWIRQVFDIPHKIYVDVEREQYGIFTATSFSEIIEGGDRDAST